ncbi:PREDICTED: GPI ethanolamine phosphate transferase 1 isoform X2 [Tarenaya hassleriana]|uniref:GPI ethanolamine phosphate transferase 1 isoform X2 n=1 Tax=Tarenaya hassleriana TaxID=28532 RepID=UPI00053C8978|nr:PREDICTED: GPI ethanolamine phosphate transferase 1 isoform X2 [Tarenaya hassleriana]
MRSDGILGIRGSDQNPATAVAKAGGWLRTRETWLVVIGVALHAVYMLSIFDIYFKTPIVHGMDPVPPRFPEPPAKRLILLISDGLRADKFYEPDSKGKYRAPFLRSIIKHRGRWGVSHARPPTESRPGHVAIIAGFYEDPSAVTKGWKANPVEFDSVFNRSRHTFAFGSPDIVPIFCSALPHSTWNSYPHEFEDFATDASFLDEWSLDQFQGLLNKSHDDPKLKDLLHQDKLVFFLHLLGCDSNGHAHRPYSSIYLNNVKVVDRIAERVYHLLEDYYGDNRTTYVFTADHGMSDKGSHGDGHPSNTDTPLVAWGAGIKYPKPTSSDSHSDTVSKFVDEHAHDMPTPHGWGLSSIERLDVNQADIAPLMSTLLGLPCPVNSVGNLPLGYMNLNEAEEVEAVLANTKQILNQFLRKSQMKRANSLYFKPFKPLAHYSSFLNEIEDMISAKKFEAAKKLSEDLRSLTLEGLHYFQTYDWLMLMTVITLGYVGWMIVLALHVLQSYTSLPGDLFKKEHTSVKNKYTGKVYLSGFLLMAILSLLNLVEHSPPLYHAYIGMTVFLWTQIFNEFRLIRGMWRFVRGRKIEYFIKLLLTAAVSIVIVELLVHSFTERKLYTWFFLIAGVVASILLHISIPWRSGIPAFVCISCWFLSVFTLMPAEIPDNNNLVVISGAIVIAISFAARWIDMHAGGNKFWQSITFHDSMKPVCSILYCIQVLLVGLSSVMVFLSTKHRTQNQELHSSHQFINWLVAENSILSRLSSIFLGLAPPFLLLSIGYEAVFYSALALVLMAWILFENTFQYSSKVKDMSLSERNMEELVTIGNGERYLRLSDVRIPLIFMVLFNVAFFGTGNFASIASFEISSVYRFITIFSPFLMAALLIFKLFIPFMLVICVFSAITKLLRVPRLGCYFLVILLSDIMTIHFFFLVKNTGSWMEIGNSISHFGIVSAQVVFVLLLFALTNMYTKSIRVQPLSSSTSLKTL